MATFSRTFLKYAVGFALLLLPAAIFATSVFLGEHKLCEGLDLKDPEPPDFKISYRIDRNLIEISGTLDIGVTTALETALKNHPDVSGVLLNSEGGNIYQGRGIARLIKFYRLDTYIDAICYSACSIAFLAGNHRYISQTGRLGFHGYRLDSGLSSTNIDLEKEQDIDFSYFAEYIDDPEFLSKIFAANCNSIWIPTLEELRAANIVP